MVDPTELMICSNESVSPSSSNALRLEAKEFDTSLISAAVTLTVVCTLVSASKLSMIAAWIVTREPKLSSPLGN
jgi:hypothetical protein